MYFASGFLPFKMNMGLALWFMFRFIFFILYVWNFWSVFCCILYFWDCIRICFAFVCKITKNTLCIFVFLLYFSITSKNALCMFVFFVFFHSTFTDCTLSFCIFRSLDMPSRNKTANPPMYVVFAFCWWFCHPQCCKFCNLGLYFLYFKWLQRLQAVASTRLLKHRHKVRYIDT